MTNWGNGGVPAKVRTQVLKRDQHTCQLQYPGCTHTATEADDIIPISIRRIPRSQVTAADCQAVCHQCHQIKTQAEAQAGRRKHLRPTRPHPSDHTSL